ncbi:hypothetical protein ACVBGC_13940 [Burkholderia stagnalis]
MAKPLYDVESLDTQTFKFTVRPLPAFGWFRKLLMVVCLIAVYIPSSQINPKFGIVMMVFLALILLWAMKGASWNRGRRFTQFTAGPNGITFLENGAATKTFALADIERMYLTAPQAGQVVVHSAIGNGGLYTGVSSTGGISATVASRSWQVVMQVRGVEHWLAGGLTEPMASSLATQVQRALPISWH